MSYLSNIFQVIGMCEKAIRFTSNHFPRCESRYEQARIPLGVALDIFNTYVDHVHIPTCTNCGAYMAEIEKTDSITMSWKCSFCDKEHITNEALTFSNCTEFEINSTEHAPETLLIIDSTDKAHENGFFDIILDNLINSIPNNSKNLAVGIASSDLTFQYTEKNLLTIPDFHGQKLPKKIFLKTLPKSFSKLKDVQCEEEFNIFNILDIANDSLSPGSNVVVFMANHKVVSRNGVEVFTPNKLPTEYKQLINSLSAKSITVSIVMMRPDYSDASIYLYITDILNGNFELIRAQNQISQIPNIMSHVLHSFPVDVQIRTLPSLIIDSSYGFRPRNPEGFIMLSNEVPVFPIRLISLGKKLSPVQIVANYWTPEGKKYCRVITRFNDLTDALKLVFDQADNLALIKLFAARFAEETLMGNQNLTAIAFDQLWKISRDYQENGLMRTVSENEILLPETLVDLPRDILCLLHLQAYSLFIDESCRQFMLRKLSTASFDTAAEFSSPSAERPNGDLLALDSVTLFDEPAFEYFDGFTTWRRGDFGDKEARGALVKVDSIEEGILKQVLIGNKSQTAPSAEEFAIELLAQIIDRGHMWVLKLRPEDIPKDF